MRLNMITKLVIITLTISILSYTSKNQFSIEIVTCIIAICLGIINLDYQHKLVLHKTQEELYNIKNDLVGSVSRLNKKSESVDTCIDLFNEYIKSNNKVQKDILEIVNKTRFQSALIEKLTISLSNNGDGTDGKRENSENSENLPPSK